MWLLWLLVSTGTLTVRAPHYGATVLVDRRPVGRVPMAPSEVSAGLHLVELRQQGTIRWRRLVFVPPGQAVVVDASWASESSSVEPTPPLPDRQQAVEPVCTKNPSEKDSENRQR